MSPKDLAKNVVPVFRQFVDEYVAAHQTRPQQQQQSMIVGGYLRPSNQNPSQNYYPPESSQAVYQQQRQRQMYQNQSPQGYYQEIRECLEAHNEGKFHALPRTNSDLMCISAARRKASGPRHPDLKWDERLARHAHQYAEYLIQTGKWEHNRSGKSEGENLYMMEGDGASRQSVKQAVDAWNAEIKDYRGQKIGQGI